MDCQFTYKDVNISSEEEKKMWLRYAKENGTTLCGLYGNLVDGNDKLVQILQHNQLNSLLYCNGYIHDSYYEFSKIIRRNYNLKIVQALRQFLKTEGVEKLWEKYLDREGRHNADEFVLGVIARGTTIIRNIVSASFTWSCTNEGHDFWESIHYRWIEWWDKNHYKIK